MGVKPKCRRVQMKPFQLVQVTWTDATSFPGWQDSDSSEGSGLEEVQTVGYFFRVTEQSVQLAPTVCPRSKTVANLWSIPRDSVRRIQRLCPRRS